MLILSHSQAWLLRTRDGKREASWRAWLLIFLLPGLFAAAAVYLLFESLVFDSKAERTMGEVTRVYEWESWTPWTGDTIIYSPVFRYQFSDGSMTEASTGQSSPNWNFEIGSTHEILYLPDVKTDVKLNNFETLWALPLIIAGISLVTLLPSLLGAWLLLRWLRGGGSASTVDGSAAGG